MAVGLLGPCDNGVNQRRSHLERVLGTTDTRRTDLRLRRPPRVTGRPVAGRSIHPVTRIPTAIDSMDFNGIDQRAIWFTKDLTQSRTNIKGRSLKAN